MAMAVVTVPAPSREEIATASISPGMAWRISVIRMITESTLPPKKPAIQPIRPPTIRDRMIASRDTSRDTRPPYTIRLKISRPMASVPSRCCAEG